MLCAAMAKKMQVPKMKKEGSSPERGKRKLRGGAVITIEFFL